MPDRTYVPLASLSATLTHEQPEPRFHRWGRFHRFVSRIEQEIVRDVEEIVEDVERKFERK